MTRCSTDERDASLVDVLRRVALTLLESPLLDEALDGLALALVEALPYEAASVILLDDSCNSVTLRALLDTTGLVSLHTNLPSFIGNDVLLRQLLQQSEPLVVPSNALPAAADSLAWHPDLPLEQAHTLMLPLRAHGQVIGALTLQRQGEAFTPAEANVLSTLAAVVALAMTSHRLQVRHQTQHGREFLINRLTMAIRQSLDIKRILVTAAEELSQVMGVSRCLIQSYPTAQAATAEADTANQVQSFTYHLSGVAPLGPPYLPELGLAPFEQAVFALRAPNPDQPDSLNPFVLNDVADCPACLLATLPPTLLADNQIKSLAIFPIVLGYELVGSITLHQCDRVRSWLALDLDLFRTLAEHLGVALAQARLFDEVAQKNEQLNTTLGQLTEAQTQLIQSEKMAVLGQFVAGIAHEVNTPLGSILGNNNTLLTCMQRLAEALAANPWPVSATSPLPAPLEPKRLELMTHLLKLNRLACQRIDETVKNLRNFARLDESELKVAHVHDGINSTLLLMRSSLPSALVVNKVFGADVPPVACYPGLLNQVFMNLIVNAVHAMADTPYPTLTLTTSVEQGELRVSLADNGKGIAPEHLDKIFDPGFTTKGRGVGTGLGLALCYRIVEKHDGRLSVVSQVGQGATFTLALPLRRSDVVPPPEPTALQA
jgi:two-component system, NtrC family, sensor kinase